MLKSDDLFLFVFREDLAALEEDYVEVMIIKGPLCCQKEKNGGRRIFWCQLLSLPYGQGASDKYRSCQRMDIVMDPDSDRTSFEKRFRNPQPYIEVNIEP